MQSKNKLNYILIILTFLFVFGINLHFKDINHDIWMHIKTGELIWKEKGLPEYDIDPFSFTADPHKWSFHEWLSQLIFYFFYKNFGLQSLIILKAVIVTFTLFLLYKIINKNTYLSLFLVSLIAIGIRYHSYIRPHIFGWFFFVLILYLIKNKRFIYLPFILIIWNNIHPSSLLGIFVVSIYLIRLFFLERKRKYIYYIIACFFSLFITPPGYAIFSIFSFSQSLSANQLIREWKPATFMMLLTGGYLFFIAFLAISFLLDKRKDFFEITLFIALAFMGFSSKRHIALVYLILAPLLYNKISKFVKIKDSLKNNLIALFIISIITICPFYLISDYFSLKVPYYNYPIKSVAFIQDNNIKGNIFNEQGDGGFLLFWLHHHNKIFIDGRIETYDDRIINEYITIAKNLPGSKTLLNRHNISIIITEKGLPLEEVLFDDPEWVFIGDEKRNSLFLRKKYYNIISSK